MRGFRVENVPVPTRYFPEARSVNVWGAVVYGLQTLRVVAAVFAVRAGLRPRYAVRLFRSPPGDGPGAG
jgi:hypothetical protein